MELAKRLKGLNCRLKEMTKLTNADTDWVKEQICTIENEDLATLQDEFDKWIDKIHDQGEPDEDTNKLIEEIDDLFIQVDESIYSIREQFGLNDAYDGYYDDYDQDDDLCKSLDDEEDDNRYTIVLDEVAKCALSAIGLDNEDDQYIDLMGTILVGILSKESDDLIAAKALGQLLLAGFMLPEDEIKKMCKTTREKCDKLLFGLGIAIDNLNVYNCTAEEALQSIRIFL